MTKQELAKMMAEKKVEISFKDAMKYCHEEIPFIAATELAFIGMITGVADLAAEIRKDKGEDAEKFYKEYKQKAWDFAKSVGLKEEDLRFRDHDQKE